MLVRVVVVLSVAVAATAVVLSLVVQVLISVLIVRVEVHSALLHQCIMVCFIHLINLLSQKTKNIIVRKKKDVPVRAYALVQSVSH